MRVVFFIIAAACSSSTAFAAGLFPTGAFSDKAAGTTAAAFLKLPASARAEALGSSFAAAADDSESLHWNPAGLARMSEKRMSEMAFSYNALIESSYAGAMSYARPSLSGKGVWGGALVYFSQESLSRYDVFGNSSGEFRPYDAALSLGWAKGFERWQAGGAVKLIRSSLGDASGNAFALDFGLQGQRVSDLGEGPLDVGVSVRNLGPAMSLGGAADPLPFKLQAGALWHISPTLGGLFDLHLPVDRDPTISIGVENAFPFGDKMKAAIRGGYNLGRNSGLEGGLTGMSGGFGVDLHRFRLDYAWVPFGELGTTHRTSLALRF